MSGTYLAHSSEGKTIFPSGYGMELTDKNMTIIKQAGKQILKMKAEVVEKTSIEKKIRESKGDLRTAVGKIE